MENRSRRQSLPPWSHRRLWLSVSTRLAPTVCSPVNPDRSQKTVAIPATVSPDREACVTPLYSYKGGQIGGLFWRKGIAGLSECWGSYSIRESWQVCSIWGINACGIIYCRDWPASDASGFSWCNTWFSGFHPTRSIRDSFRYQGNPLQKHEAI